ncbi:MAG: deoxyribodipyrimidine photo-lyase [Candidatus Endobugula sp.]|jgi:deoxyribodipyrimidine photo-lyase
MMTETMVIHWFRQDLRLSDNPSLLAASKHDMVIPIYILDDHNADEYAMGGASRWWLHHSLQSLNQSLDGKLSLYAGDPLAIILALVERYPIRAVSWNRCYEPWRIKRDVHIKEQLKAKGIVVESYNGSLLWEPWTIKKKDDSHYKVFTPFYRKGCLAAASPREPLAKPDNAQWHYDTEESLAIDELKLLPNIHWDQQLEPHWNIGEQGAQLCFQQFVNEGLNEYKGGRDFPAKPYFSGLSPHLHFGEISPNQIWYAVRSLGDNQHIDTFCSQLGWREFSYSQLYHHPGLPRKNLQSKFDRFPWQDNAAKLRAWQTGKTGIPMVDAGMRQLWQTGTMHNRVRMVVGSFLVKNLLQHWHHGERWFWDTLADADLANNSASWQWVAGCGGDAAPYFRIFNPVIQGQKFDVEGDYVRHFVPELSLMPKKYLFNPWEAPESVLAEAGVQLGVTYPKPIVDLKVSRQMALEAFKSLTITDVDSTIEEK